MSNRPILFAVLPALAAMLPAATLAADELPPRAFARIGDHRFYHGPGVACAVLSPDGRYVASAAAFPVYFRHVTDRDRDAYERAVVLWDAATGERVREFRAPGGPVWHLAFAPDGKRLAAVGRFGVALFEVESGRLLRSLGGDAPWRRPQFSADGTELRVANYQGPLTAWEVSSGKRLRKWDPPTGPSEWVKEREHVHVVVPSPDGKVIAWLLWQAPDYSKVPPGVFPPPPVPRSTALVVADAGTGKPLYRREFEPGALDSFPFSADGRRFLTAGVKLQAWDTATGKELLAVEGPSAHRFALSPDGLRALVADGNSRVRLWDLEAKKPLHEFASGQTYVNSHTLESPQTFSADGKTLVLATNSTLRRFDTATGQERGPAGHRTAIEPQFSADGRTLVTTGDEARCRWDLSGKEPALRSCESRHLREGICGDGARAHSADGRLFVDDRDGRTRVCESATGRVVSELDGAPRAFFGLFTPDARRVLLWLSGSQPGADDGIRLYDVRTGKLSGRFETKNAVGRSVVFSPDGRLVAWTDQSHTVRLHDAATGKTVRALPPARPLPRAECDDARLLFTADGSHLVVTTYACELFAKPDEPDKWETFPTRVLRVADGREVAHFYANPRTTRQGAKLSCAAGSPDGRLLAMAEEESGAIRLIEIASGGGRAELAGHRHGVRGLAFSPDGKTLASGGEDNVALLWDVTGARTGPAGRPGDAPDLAAWWADLAADDAGRAGAGVSAFVRTPGPGVGFLSERLRAAEAPGEKRLAELLAGLNADNYPAREAATRELARLGERAEAALRR
ncbi:MAG TPA: hypothetical protein VKD90_10260, partial [Gemmataceae bacterium]|nr:hypothetical protein [Gemmataceae bacterium]